MKKSNFLTGSGLLALVSATAFAHGIIEKPASREQFCGVETRPEQIYSKLTHEKCRPMLSKADGSLDNSIYNFMAVLTHTTGRQGRTQQNLPKHVCGFDSENWGGGKTPWDSAIDWPTSTIASGTNQFVWNISWGNHFADTEEFAYWITKADFKFPTDRELSWNDFEEKPFCVLKYDDRNPNANPNIKADKTTNKFTTTCTVPPRQGRAVIYGEWGRNYFTFERFHSCMDVEFSGSPVPVPAVKAVISPLAESVKGAVTINLDGSKSEGQNLAYQWTISASDPSSYTLTNATSSIAKLTARNISAEQRVVVNLAVQGSGFSDNTSTTFLHVPAINDTWKQVGSTLVDTILADGDKVSLRIIDSAGKDIYLPATPVTLDAETAKSANWSYTLAQAVNGKNTFSVNIGVLNTTTRTVEPVRSATENRVYVPVDSAITNAYVVVQKKDQPSTSCRAVKKSGGSAYWLGYDIYSDRTPITLDFTASGIDLRNVTVDPGVFFNVTKLSNSKLLINTKPAWVTKTTPGYIGFRADGYDQLNTSIVASCDAG